MTFANGSAGASAAEQGRRKREKAAALLRQADKWEKGAEGEGLVAQILETLPGDCRVLHDLSVPGSSANIDHIVISPTGVFVVDAKNWNGTLKMGKDTLWRGKYPIRKECETVSWEAATIADFIGHRVVPLLCIVTAQLPRPTQVVGGVTACQGSAVLTAVAAGAGQLTSAERDAIHARLVPLVRADPSPEGPCRSQATRRAAPAWSSPLGPPMPAPLVTHQAAVPSRQWPRRCLRLAGLLAFGLLALALIPFAAKQIARSIRQSLPPAPTTAAAPEADPGVGPEADSPATSDVAAAASVTPTSDPTATPFSPPVLDFSCPVPGEGWVVTLAPSEFREDPVGFDMWYRAGDNWVYWGIFRSGGQSPYSFGAVAAEAIVEVKAGRAGVLAVDDAALSTFVAPPDPC